jgi:hypothetical protein
MLAEVADQAQQTTEVLLRLRAADPQQWAASTSPMLNAFGEISMAWRLLDMARIAWERYRQDPKKSHYCSGKIYQAKFFMDEILPNTQTTLRNCARQGREIVDIPDRAF